jgi:hypothetical protein
MGGARRESVSKNWWSENLEEEKLTRGTDLVVG